ncbi:hypothetical protein LFM09_27380 [Lentzea alba]|uniref:hypothetical protein n=1 Tax=Lentzea alba TaxID=2714351 RepID=UPI0039BEF87C
MRETVARIAKPAVIALAGAAAMFSAASPASAMPVVEKDLPVGDLPVRVASVPLAVASVPLAAAGTAAEVASGAPVVGEAIDRTPPVADLASSHEPITDAVARVPQRVIEVPLGQ